MDPIIIASLVSGLAQTGMGFGQAIKQKGIKKKAEKAAAAAMADARKRLDVNVMDELSLPKEAYELERESVQVAAAQALNEAAQSERGVAATAGRVQQAMNQQARLSRVDQEKRLNQIQKMQLAEDRNLLNMGYNLDMMELGGAQQAASDAQMASSIGMQAGVAGLGDVVTSTGEMVDLYQKTPNVRQGEKLLRRFEHSKKNGTIIHDDVGAMLSGMGYKQFEGVTDSEELGKLLEALDPDAVRGIYKGMALPMTPNVIQYDPYIDAEQFGYTPSLKPYNW